MDQPEIYKKRGGAGGPATRGISRTRKEESELGRVGFASSRRVINRDADKEAAVRPGAHLLVDDRPRGVNAVSARAREVPRVYRPYRQYRSYRRTEAALCRENNAPRPGHSSLAGAETLEPAAPPASRLRARDPRRLETIGAIRE